MIPTTKAQKFLIMFGEGNNGKGVILAALEADTPVFLGAALVATGDAEAVDLTMVTKIGQVGFKLAGGLRREIWFDLIHE